MSYFDPYMITLMLIQIVRYNQPIHFYVHSYTSNDGDHPTKGPKEAEGVKEGQEATKDAKGIQTMVRNLLFQAQNILPSSPGNHPIFVHMLAQAPLGMIDCNLPYPEV